MGVHGLWKLLEPAGKPVPVETLENKVLAVDVSIWLHQAARGFQDARGQALPNAHLLGLFHRLCKLLFWRVRPVFVFDGGAPLLKQQTVAARRRRREDAQERADRTRRRLLELHLKKRAVQEALSEREGGAPRPLPPLVLPPSSQAPAEDMFTLPPPRRPSAGSEEEDDPSSGDDAASSAGAAPSARLLRLRQAGLDLHSVDVRSADFLALPADVRHEILTELKETRKQSSWGRLHEMPRESVDFSSYQMKRLLKRRSVQESLEAVEKEMRGRSMSLAELKELMAETGALAAAALPGQRIAADATTRYIFVSGSGGGGGGGGAEVDKTEDASKTEATSEDASPIPEQSSTSQINIASLYKPIDDVNEYFEEFSDEEVAEWLPEFDFTDANVGSDDLIGKQLKAAHNFIFENSGLTQEQILAVIKDHSSSKTSALDQPSTSKAGCSRALDQSCSKEKSSKESISSTSECSVFDMPSTSKEVVNCPEEKQNHSNSENENDSLVTSHFSYGSEKSTVKPALNNYEMKVQSIQDACTYEVENKSIKKETVSRELKSPTVMLATSSCDRKSREGGMQSKDSTSQFISFIPNKNASVSAVEESTIKTISQSAQSISKDTVGSSHLDKVLRAPNNDVDGNDSCSSTEDLVEVAECDQSGIIQRASMQTPAKPAPLQVVIQTGMTDIREDIFADVFDSSEKLKKSKIQDISLLHESDHFTTKQSNSCSHSNVSDEMTSKEQFVYSQNKMASTEENPCPISYTSGTEDVMMMSDNESEVSEEEMAEESKSRKENQDKIQTKETITLTTEQLEKLEGSLQEEGNQLQKVQAREERLAASITDQMVQEAQELLQLFGVPYVVAPMEAEAQCAFLDRASLTDGTITDDSDVWLFGGQKVYKNFFDQKKHVLQFRDIDILHSFKLTRSQLVLLALLVGSDYTTGLSGVGPVTALEILAAFPPSSKQGPPDELVEGLRNFREWYFTGKEGRWDKTKLRNKLKDLDLSREFPSVPVVEAYLSPKVDESLEKFSWGDPDVESIKDFARVKFGWPTSKTHEILFPIMKKLNIKITQLSIESYFQPKPKLPPAAQGLSKRVQEAVDRIDAPQDRDSEEGVGPMGPSPPKKSKSILSNMRNEINKARSKMRKLKDPPKESASMVNRGRGRGARARGNAGPGTRNVRADELSLDIPSTSTSAPDIHANEDNESSVTTANKREFIPQREKDKLNLLKNKLKAIEVFRKSGRGLDKTKRERKKKREILSEANLSESSSSNDE